ncbi:MAG: hypothetical protein Q9212_003511, partial [Teloschistes hypoglaucus]
MGTEVALLEWVNTFALPEDVKSLSELTDGHVLWDILRDVDPTYFTSSLPETRGNSTRWVPRYENLKHLHKALTAYIFEENEQDLYAPHAGDGLKFIAQDASIPDFRKLFQLVLQATILSPRQQDYILKMTSLTPASQQSLKELIEDREVAKAPDSNAPTTFMVDPELQYEERYGKLMADYELLLQERKDFHNEIRDLNDRLIRLQEQHDVLQQSSTEAQEYLQKNGSLRDRTDGGSSVKDLESKFQQQENDFADQEARLAKQARRTEALQRKLDNVEASSNSAAKKAQEARDELDMVKRNRDALAKKANMAEKFKQQLQSSNILKKEVESLRSQLVDHRKDADSYDEVRRSYASLEVELQEFKKLVPRVEEDNAELIRVKEKLMHDNQNLQKQHKQDQSFIAQLQQRVRSSSVSSVGSHNNNDLDDEFAGLTDHTATQRDETRGYEMQMKHHERIAQEKDAKIHTLQRLLDEANSQPRQTHAVQRPSRTLSGSLEIQGSANSSDTCQSLREQFENEEAKRGAVSTQLHDKIREIGMAKEDRESLLNLLTNVDKHHFKHLAVSYVAVDKIEILAQFKTDNAAELQRLQRDSTDLKDYPQLSQEIKDLIAAVKTGNQEKEDPSKAVDHLSEIIMQSRKQLVEAEKEIQQQRTTIDKLEKQAKHTMIDVETRGRKEQEQKSLLSISHDPRPTLKQSACLPASFPSLFFSIPRRRPISPFEVDTNMLTIWVPTKPSGPPSTRSPSPAELLALRTETANLTRELHLMASAYHSLGHRISYQGTVVQRQAEQPSSWLGRQRRAVDGNLNLVG